MTFLLILAASIGQTDSDVLGASVRVINEQTFDVTHRQPFYQVHTHKQTAFSSGTVVDSNGCRALVVGCGHEFEPTGRVTVVGRDKTAYNGKLIYHSGEKERDVSIIEIHAKKKLPTVLVSGNGELFPGERCWLTGYARDDPQLRGWKDRRIKSRVPNAPKVWVNVGIPMGFSGGGVFHKDEDGWKLYGVANMTTIDGQSSVYTDAESVRIGMKAAQFRLGNCVF